MGFNSAFKGLNTKSVAALLVLNLRNRSVN